MLAQPYQDLSDDELYQLCIWREADDCGIDGMRGVAHVIDNRVQYPGWWGVDLRTVILAPWQFSCFNHGDPDERRWPEDDNHEWLAATAIVDAMLLRSDSDLTDNATSYYDVSIEPPSWTLKMQFTVQIMSLRFYREELAAAH